MQTSYYQSVKRFISSYSCYSFLLFSACLLLLLLMPIKIIAQPRLQQLPGQCAFAVRLPYRVGYSHFLLRQPARYVLDMLSLSNGISLGKYQLNNCVVRSVRVGQHKSFKTRLVFDLARPVDAGVQLRRLSTFPVVYRLQISFPRLQQSPVLPVKPKSAVNLRNNDRVTNKAAKKVTKSIVLANEKTAARLRPVVIVIDPGHGGKDPGATSAKGVHEKNVVLAISRYLQRDLNAKRGFKAYLTRNSDRYIALRERLTIARKYKPDLFIAIHADAFKNKEAHGSSVFALSQRGATSEAARWLARKENSSELVGGVDLEDKTNDLKSVLLDLSQTATIASSVKVGSNILQQLKRHAKLHHKRVEQAAFVVLKSPDIPSLLVETGFLSNRREAARLSVSSYQKKIALALSKGIVSHFSQHPPRGSWLAWRRQRKSIAYMVRPGDSLSVLAHSHDVSVSSIKKFNQLKSSRLLVNQQINIPRKQLA